MTRALVTGAGGFCGRHLTGYLRELGIEVHTLGTGRTQAQVHHHIDDVASIPSLMGVLKTVKPHYVFHLAGAAYASDPTLFYKINTQYAVALLHAMDACGFRNCPVLLVGTAAEYGRVDKRQLPIREDLSPHPYNHYGISKLAQTFVGLAAGGTGRPIVIVRPFNIIGSGMPDCLVVQNFARQIVDILLRKKLPIMKIGNLNTSRDFVDVRDVVSIYWRLVQTSAAYGQIVNVCSGTGILIRELLLKLFAISGVTVEVKQDPSLLKPMDVPEHFGSTEKLRKLIGVVPTLQIEETLKNILDNMLSREGKLLHKRSII
jgi:GDP-4-dehydro-6-deoxy-D-mannose reductase